MSLPAPVWAVVIPAYNESRTIRDVAGRALAQAPMVIVVDDGSTDGTAAALDGLPVILLRNDANRGKAASLYAGADEAIRRGAASILTLDGDGQHFPEDIPLLAQAHAELPGRIVIGSRLHQREEIPPVRYWANRFANFWISWAAGYAIADSQSGFRIYPAMLFSKAKVNHGEAYSFVFESEILIEAARLGVHAKCVPVRVIYSARARPSHFRPVVDFARIARMVVWRLLTRGLYLQGLYRRFKPGLIWSAVTLPYALLTTVCVLYAGVSQAQEGSGFGLRAPRDWLAQADERAVTRQSENPSPDVPGRAKSYQIPALEIVGFDTMLNLFNRAFLNRSGDYSSNLTSIRRNLRDKWVEDNDPYKVNQIGHPYQGSMYHGFARSAGLSYWEAAGYTFAGSAFWEIAGERTRPSRNDQVASGVGGSFFGEALFRMAHLVLEHGGGMSPAWREWAAAAISPSMGLNRHLMGYRSIYSSNGAPFYSRLALGLSGQIKNNPGSATKVRANEVLLDFSLDYGLPGKPGYTYTRPFDYFAFQATASSANVVENVMTRGLLYGKDYEMGGNYRGVAGIYGSYDYIAPQTYRISSTALSVGTTAQAWLKKDVALQGTALVGVGYAAVGTSRGAREGDYHYGVTPQALLALRLIFGDKASLDLTARDYFVTSAGGTTGGRDNIIRTDLAFTWRFQRQHAISVRYLWNRRDAKYPVLGDRTQTRTTFGIYYTLLGSDRFGAVDWR